MTATIATGVARIIPLQPENQTLTITLVGVSYNLSVWWNARSQCWILDVRDDQDNDVVTGIPLVTGADLLEQFYYLNIDGALVVQSANDPTLVPSLISLGVTGELYFVTPT